MPHKIKVALVRIKRLDHSFELATVPGTVKEYRKKKLSLQDVLVSDSIYSNYSKCDRARRQDLEEAFGSKDENEWVKYILEHGSCQETAEEKREHTEQMKKKLVYLIQTNFVEPSSNMSHPPDRIESALKSSKYRFDSGKSPEDQLNKAVAAIRGIIMLKKKITQITLTLNTKYAAHCSRTIYSKSKVISEKYDNENAIYVLDILPGETDQFLSALNKATKGDYKIVFGEMAGEEREPIASKKAKKKSKSRRK